MDLIGQYSDSDAEESPRGSPRAEALAPRPPIAPAPTSAPVPGPQLRSVGPTAQLSSESRSQFESQAAFGLFNPFAPSNAERPSSHMRASPPSSGSGAGTKRDFLNVTGSGPLQDAPSKASRTGGTLRGPKPAFNTELVPPQLRNGRTNISTEDMEKIFTKKNLSRRQPK
ncbi:hypothetical protein VaNZ11_005228 [Volvox africanus]|uniref:Uncharacterized protein n=1 Tax=Volvox africanus TaxID=51714 RepID=A0ABQ5RYS3_9CHLO|nr:hypothetical protein VaNZ11_005228 [Volvox africanus]